MNMASHTTMGGRSSRLSQFTLDQSDADFAHDLNRMQDSEDEDFYANDTSTQDFVLDADRMMDWRYMLQHGGLGHFLCSRAGRFLLNTSLFAALFGSGIVFIVANRFIIWGPYLKENYTKETRLMYMLGLEHTFAYPYITSWLQLVVAYVLLVLFTSLIAFKSTWLENAGLLDRSLDTRNTTSKVAASNGMTHASDWKGLLKGQSGLFKKTFSNGLLVAIHVVLTTRSLVRNSMPDFIFARIGVIPLSLIFSSIISGYKHPKSTIISSTLATVGLAFSTHPAFVTLERTDIAASIISSALIALVPITSAATHRSLREPQEYNTNGHRKDNQEKCTGNTIFGQEELHAFLNLANHTLSLAICLLMPVVTLSGELNGFLRNWSGLGFKSYWMLVLLSGVSSLIGFLTMIVLAVTTSPLSTTFVFIPQSSLVWPIMLGNRLILQIWLFLGLTWACCAWFVVQNVNRGT